jgi:two-component sensor histidine kinase/AmiR/NasT family two-component response regulator
LWEVFPLERGVGLQKNRVLVVEDDEIVTIRIRNKLEEWGYEVVDIVNTGADAVESALLTRPDLILMDIVIKGDMDGIDAANKINKYFRVPVIYLTAFEDEDTIRRAKATIPDAYILKPFADKKLKMALDIALCRHEMQVKLKQSERKYRSLFENSLNGVAVFDILRDEENTIIDFKLIEFNSAFKSIVDMSASEVVGKTLKQIIPRFDGNRIFKPLCNLQSLDDYYRKEHYSHMLQKYFDLGAFLIEKDTLAIVLIDITDYKNVEKDLKSTLKEKNAFLREIHHRVNNNMQIISYFLNLQIDCMKYPEDKEICMQTKDRINSMAMVHELLYSSRKISEINIKEYVENIVHELAYTYTNPEQLKLDIEVDDLYFNLETAVPLGLIINELITNCIKHAFQPDECGRIKIVLKKDGSKYFLRVEDDGVGLPVDLEWQDNNTVGLALVKQLTLQMDGKMGIKSDQGTSCIIEFMEQDYRDRVNISNK